ncbi:hypothetical protein LCGC14_0381670 [marine sediment metagenome]|uniref:PD-(D/E)XK endonuclease-like domain-containing protein n=1 Tax=marine sediment metagenome TaxID=412755 RepID=A0A0F9T1X6_9ZZZZ
MIVDKLYVGEHTPWSPLSKGIFRMSGAEQCTRRAGYQFLRTPEDEEFVPGIEDFKAVVLAEGNLHETEVVRRIQQASFKIWNFGQGQAWTRYRFEKQFWRGYPDLFVEIDEKAYGVEIKSTGDELFNDYASKAREVLPGRFILDDQTVLHDSAFPYMGQIQMYLHSEAIVEEGIDQWLLVLKNRDNGAMLECLIEKDSVYLESIITRWKYFWVYVTAGRLPKQNFEETSKQCQLCPFKERCWSN